MTIIRPMCLVHESDLEEMAQVRDFKKQIKNCPYETQSNRTDMKGVLKQLEALNPEARYSLWGSMTNVQEELLPIAPSDERCEEESRSNSVKI